MKVLGLDGRFHVWNLTCHQSPHDDVRPRSALHLEVRALLKSLWPTEPLLEEIHLPGSFGLFADFFLPKRKLMVESSGEQHFKFVSHFHGDLAGFKRSKVRDENKRKWCEINKFSFIELKYNEDISQWRQLLTKT